MRAIKFRVWDTTLEKMLDMKEIERSGMNLFALCEGVNIVKLMQYTGLTDRNGKEIYEGDVVWVHHIFVENVPSYKALIEWDKYRFAIRNLDDSKLNYQIGPFPMNNLDAFGKDFDVIGNIYENPELLDVSI